MHEASARFATPPFKTRTTLPRKNDGTANGACVIHPIHKTSFTRTPRQNITNSLKSCAERRRELGGYGRHVLIELRNIFSTRSGNPGGECRKLRPVSASINKFMKKNAPKGTGNSAAIAARLCDVENQNTSMHAFHRKPCVTQAESHF